MQKILQTLKNIYRWIGSDGLLHISFSALIMIFFGWIHPLWIPALVTFAAGLGKEAYDCVTGKCMADWHDIICDTSGIVIGFVLIIILTGF